MNARMHWVAWLLGAAALVSGCALDNVGSNYSLQEKGDTGILVAALGRAGAIEFDMNAVVRSVGGGRTYTIIVDNSTVQKDFGQVVIPPAHSEASDWGYVPAAAPLERLVVVPMRAGEYEISTVNGQAPRFKGSSASPFSIVSDRLGLRFSVRPGQITYLGSIVFGFPDWLATSHPHGPLRVLTADTRERDAKLFNERYPNLGGNLPERTLSDGPYSSPNLRYYLFVSPEGGDSRGGM